MNQIFATHNSLTGERIKSWWFGLGSFIAKCQSLSLAEQYQSGVRFFDLRFAKKGDVWYGAHGMMLYDITLESALSLLASLATKEDPIWFRVLSEDTYYKNSDVFELALKVDYLLMFQDTESLNPICVRRKTDWHPARDYNLSSVASYDDGYNCPIWRIGTLKEKIKKLKTPDDVKVLIACYSSVSIPYLFAFLMRRFVRKRLWKSNEIPVVDFIKIKRNE